MRHRLVTLLALPVLVLPLLAGCANHTQQDLEARLGTLIGAPEADLVRRMGVPSRSYETEGRKFLAYFEPWADYAMVPGASFSGGMFGGGGGLGVGYGYRHYPEMVNRFCETTFEVVRGRVASFTLRGSSCGWGGWPVIGPA